MAFSWPGVYNQDWSWMTAPQNLGLGKGFSGDAQGYYNNPGSALSSLLGGGSQSPYGDQGASNNYGYGNLSSMFAPAGGMQQQQPAGGTAPGAYGSGSGMMGMGAQSPTPGMFNSLLGSPGSIPGSVQKGNVAYSGVSPEEKLLDMMFRTSATGQGKGGPISNQLFNLGMGRLPPALAEQIMGQTQDSFGKMGARFGTDLATAESRGLAQASESQSLNAIQQILGLGGTTAGFQFQRGESALQRALQDLMSQRSTDQSSQLIQALLGGFGGSSSG